MLPHWLTYDTHELYVYPDGQALFQWFNGQLVPLCAQHKLRLACHGTWRFTKLSSSLSFSWLRCDNFYHNHVVPPEPPPHAMLECDENGSVRRVQLLLGQKELSLRHVSPLCHPPPLDSNHSYCSMSSLVHIEPLPS
eukprot:TRINITY_DN4334_c0_g1_i1.p2 TRINITY_DN4334_c0_g1~~TRINITY_DN4334_c0_g1_i1.p2  ORF type:complete len:137 (-),score=26.41 TRINITY_DN4334_c0_g1_i1:88-498(-)